MNQQPELPDLVRDLEILQSLNRNLYDDENLTDDPDVLDTLSISEKSLSV